jgi:FkbM family methyltransferase
LNRLLTAWYRAPDHLAKLRVLRWIENILGNRRMVVQTIPGFHFSIDRADWIQRGVLYEGIWEPEVTALFRDNLKASDVFYDVGANVGYFSCLALHVGVAQVVAFEPDPLNGAIFRGNLALNPEWRSERLTLLREGVGGEITTLRFQRSHVSNTGMSRFGEGGGVASFEVPITTLDEIVFGRGLPAPTVIKADIEGMEWEAFQGSRRLLQERPPRLILFEADADASLQIRDMRLLQFLTSFGYRVERVPQKNKVDEKENFTARLEAGRSAA